MNSDARESRGNRGYKVLGSCVARRGRVPILWLVAVATVTTGFASCSLGHSVSPRQVTAPASEAPRERYDSGQAAALKEYPESFLEFVTNESFEGVVTGEVVATKVRIRNEESASVNTRATLKIDKTTNARTLTAGSRISVYFPGGITTKGQVNKGLEGKDDAGNALPVSPHDPTVIEWTFKGVMPPTVGEEVLLFLTKSSSDPRLWVPMSLVRGIYFLDEDDGSYRRRGEPDIPELESTTISDLNDVLSSVKGPDGNSSQLS